MVFDFEVAAAPAFGAAADLDVDDRSIVVRVPAPPPPAPVKLCPHGRPIGEFCPHCAGLFRPRAPIGGSAC